MNKKFQRLALVCAIIAALAAAAWANPNFTLQYGVSDGWSAESNWVGAGSGEYPGNGTKTQAFFRASSAANPSFNGGIADSVGEENAQKLSLEVSQDTNISINLGKTDYSRFGFNKVLVEPNIKLTINSLNNATNFLLPAAVDVDGGGTLIIAGKGFNPKGTTWNIKGGSTLEENVDSGGFWGSDASTVQTIKFGSAASMLNVKHSRDLGSSSTGKIDLTSGSGIVNIKNGVTLDLQTAACFAPAADRGIIKEGLGELLFSGEQIANNASFDVKEGTLRFTVDPGANLKALVVRDSGTASFDVEAPALTAALTTLSTDAKVIFKGDTKANVVAQKGKVIFEGSVTGPVKLAASKDAQLEIKKGLNAGVSTFDKDAVVDVSGKLTMADNSSVNGKLNFADAASMDVASGKTVNFGADSKMELAKTAKIINSGALVFASGSEINLEADKANYAHDGTPYLTVTAETGTNSVVKGNIKFVVDETKFKENISTDQYLVVADIKSMDSGLKFSTNMSAADATISKSGDKVIIKRLESSGGSSGGGSSGGGSSGGAADGGAADGGSGMSSEDIPMALTSTVQPDKDGKVADTTVEASGKTVASVAAADAAAFKAASGLDVEVKDGKVVFKAGTPIDAGDFTVAVTLSDGTKANVKLTVKEAPAVPSTTLIAPAKAKTEWTTLYNRSTKAFTLTVPITVPAGVAGLKLTAFAYIDGKEIKGTEVPAKAKGADVTKKFEFKGTCDDPAKVTISSVKYRIGTVPYTQDANVKLSDTNITTTDTAPAAKSSSSGGCDAGFGVLALAAAAAIVLRKNN